LSPALPLFSSCLRNCLHCNIKGPGQTPDVSVPFGLIVHVANSGARPRNGGALFFGTSAIIASVVRSRPATEAASCNADRTTFVGSNDAFREQVAIFAGLSIEAPGILVVFDDLAHDDGLAARYRLPAECNACESEGVSGYWLEPRRKTGASEWRSILPGK
jgi:hypothetical protein